MRILSMRTAMAPGCVYGSGRRRKARIRQFGEGVPISQTATLKTKPTAVFAAPAQAPSASTRAAHEWASKDPTHRQINNLTSRFASGPYGD